ncbi:unnamed protein product [Bemisia tabaci]|uniref:PHLPP-like RA domain-containing protein n=1 Tax=Bemisia tabaci TaxID=7038 RepID=A0A9P0AE95_BEMTA|nr:unnamed protein product [Bemisia tabaci]
MVKETTIQVGEKFGWVRLYDCDDSSSSGNLYGGAEERRLKSDENPLIIQDEFLRQIGYSDPSRRDRLGVDINLKYLIKFYIGPTCQEKNMRSGQVHILKGLVLPQWKLRDLVIIGENLFLYPAPYSNAELETVNLSKSQIEVFRELKCNKKVIRISGSRPIFLGFQSEWDRLQWKRWLNEVKCIFRCEVVA